MGQAICKENASELAKLGNQIRWTAWRAAKLAEQAAKDNPPPLPIAEPIAIDSFREEMLCDVRAKMKAIMKRMDDLLDAGELDSKVFKELTESLARLETMEQKLSMRSAPAAMKPAAAKASKSRQSYSAPLEVNQASPAPIQDANEPNG